MPSPVNDDEPFFFMLEKSREATGRLLPLAELPK